MRPRLGFSLLAAVLIFASGLSFLRHLERDEQRELESRRSVEVAPDGLAPRTPVPPGLSVDGSVQVNHYSAGPDGVRTRAMELEATDTDSAPDGGTILHDVRIVLNDVESGEVRAVILAVRGRTYLIDPVLGVREEREFEEDYVWLEEIVVTLYRDVPVAPLKLQVPRLEGSLKTQTFTSDERAVATAPGLHAVGTGLLLDLTRGVLRFDADAVVRLSEGEEEQARLSSSGRLHILRGSEGRGGAEVVARDAARLVTYGKTPLEVFGDQINAIATDIPGSAEGLHLERLAADRGAVVESPIGRFTADRAELRTDAEGTWKVTLHEEPRADLEFERAEGEEPLAVHLEGAGPLQVVLRDEYTFDLPGPARAVLADIELESEGGLRGEAAEDRSVFELETTVGTKLTRQDTEVRAGAITARVALVEGGRPSIEVATRGVTVLEGVTDAAEPYRLNAEEYLQLEARGDAWVVPEAEGVALELGSDPPVRIRARTVRDLEIEAERFIAEGNVDVVRGEQRVQGDRFVARGAESFTLWGAADSPARLTGPGTEVLAQQLVREGARLIAEGDVRARLEHEDGTAHVHGSYLELFEQWSEAGTQRLTLRSKGSVDTRVLRSEDRFEGTGDALEAELDRTFDSEGVVLTSRGRLDLSGSVHVQAAAPGLEREVFSDRVSLSHEAPNDVEWDLVAAGNLRFLERGGLELNGTGDRLLASQGGEATFLADEGQLVHVEGLLPGGSNPFVLESPEVHWSADTIRAKDVVLRVSEFVLLKSAPGDIAGNPELIASAQTATLGETELSLEGNVKLDGVDELGDPVSLESAYALLTGNPDAEAGGYGRVDAGGGFKLGWGDSLIVAGDVLDARSASGRLRITGTPAEVRYGNYVQVAEFLEYDLYLRMIVGTTRSSVRPLLELASPPKPGVR